jgi:hypothetical protein
MKELLDSFTLMVEEDAVRSDQFGFNAEHPQQRILMMSYGTMLELARGIVLLLTAKDRTCTPIAIRSLIEVYVDFVNASEDPHYIGKMFAAWFRQEERILSIALTTGSRNWYLSELSRDPAAPKRLEFVRQELKRLQSEDMTDLSIKKRFEKAGLLSMYEGIYTFLSREIHGNIDVLENRHLRYKPDGWHVHYFEPIGNRPALLYMLAVVSLLDDSFKRLKHKGIRIPDKVDAKHRERATEFGRYLKEAWEQKEKSG